MRCISKVLGASKRGAVSGHLWQRALGILSSAPQLVSKASRNAGISACEKGRQWQMALELLGSDLEPIAVNSALSACVKARRWRPALALLERLPRRDAVSEALGLSALAARHSWAKALGALRAPRSESQHTTLLSAMERSMRWELAMQLLELHRSDQGCEVASIAASRARRWQEALQVLRGFFAQQHLVQACEQSGCWGHSFTQPLLCSERLVQSLRRRKVDLPEPPETAPKGRGRHIEILIHPGTTPSNAPYI